MIPGIARGGLRWHGSGRPTRDCGRVLSLGPRCTRLSWRRCGRRWPSGTGRSRSWRTGSANWTARPGGTRPRRAGPRPRTARTRRPARSRWTGRCGRRPDGSGCGTVTEGQAPPWACGRAQYGPRAHAHAADLVCGNRIPVARAARLMAAMLGLRVGRAGRRGSRQGRRPAGPVHRAGPRPAAPGRGAPRQRDDRQRRRRPGLPARGVHRVPHSPAHRRAVGRRHRRWRGAASDAGTIVRDGYVGLLGEYTPASPKPHLTSEKTELT